MSKQILIVLFCICSALALFRDDSAVFKLTAKNFKDQVVNSDQFWLVEFYAPWCGHCKKSAPEFEKAAQILQGVIRVGAVNMDEERAAGEPYHVQGYPTIKFFGKNKKQPLAYESGERTFETFVTYAVEQMKKQIDNRMNNESTEL